MTTIWENGVSEYDVYDRIDNEIALFGRQSRGEKEIKTLAAAKKIMRRLEQLHGQTLQTRQRKTKKARQFIIRWIL